MARYFGNYLVGALAMSILVAFVHRLMGSFLGWNHDRHG